MQDGGAERELLLGILALQNNFVTQAQLLTGFREWANDKSQRLADILERQKALRPSLRSVLESLVDAHIENNDNSAEQSLASVQPLSNEFSTQLHQLADEDLERSLSGLDEGSDECIELTLSMGQQTSDCGRFHVLRPHRRGGLGEVFIARDCELDREVALKQILHRRVDDEVQRLRFVREAEITGKLEHPGVVPVYGLGHDENGRPYYAMRFIRGNSLREALEEFHAADSSPHRDLAERNKQFRRLLGWFNDVCDAISYAHSRGVLHRDLKPNNVMLGPYGETLVVDWGLARVAGVDEQFGEQSDERPVLANLSGSSTDTLDGTAIGTPAYMSPEQAEGRLDLLTPATDVYSLGATLFAIITGQPPLTGKPMDVIQQVLKGDIPSAREVNPKAPAALEAVCRKAMALKRDDRYQNPRELAADVEAWLADEPVGASPDLLRDRIRRWTRRHQTMVATAVAAVLIIAVGASAAATLLRRKNKQLDNANAAIQGKNSELLQSNHETEEARRRASTVKDYLVAAFRNTDPTQDGRKLTVAEVLENSLREMDDTLDENDPIRADLLKAIGSSYRGLGLYREMLQVFTTEYELRQRTEGPQAEATLRAAYNVAMATYYTGDYGAAIERHKRNIEEQIPLLGADHDITLSSMNGLAMALGSDGQLPAAMELYEKLRERRTAIHGDDALETLMAVNNLATSYHANGRMKEAHALLIANLDEYKRLFGEDHLQTLMAMDRLASVSNALGNSAEAIKLYEQALEKRRAKLGDDHPVTVESIAGLAFAYRDAARLDDARRLLEEALATRRETFGADHPMTLSSMNDLARVYLSLGMYDEASALAEKGAEKCEATLSDSNPKTLAALNTLAMIYYRQGRPEAAVPVFEKLLDVYVREYSNEHPTTNSIRNNLAMTYRYVGQLQTALPLFEETLTWRKQELGADHPKTLISMQNLVSALRSLGRLKEALPQAESTLQSHRRKLGDSHRYTLSAMEILANTYLDLGHLRKALPLADEALSNAKDSLPSQHPDIAKGMDLVANVYLKSAEIDKAVELCRETIKLRTEILGEHHPATLSSMIRLSECCLLQGDFEQARALVSEAHAAAVETFGESHPLSLRAAGVYGTVLVQLRQFDDAVERLSKSLKAQQDLFGENHPAVLKTQHHLADAFLQQVRLDEAAQLLQQTLRQRTDKLGPAHPDTFRSRLALADCLLSQEKYQDASDVLSSAARRQADFPKVDPLPVERELSASMAAAFVRLYQATGDAAKAAEWMSRLSTAPGGVRPIPDGEN